MIPQKITNIPKKIGTDVEKYIVKYQLTPGSGSGHIKGDIVSDFYVIESKATQKDSINLKYKWLAKLVGDTPIGKKPLLYVTFVDTQNKPRYNGVWVCMRQEDF